MKLLSIIMSNLEENDLLKLQFKPLEFYFKPQSLERWKVGLVYKALGVGIFKKIVPTCETYISHLIGYKPIAGKKDRKKALKDYEPYTRAYESIHVLTLGINTSFIIDAISEGDFTSHAIISNHLVNVYPIMLQR